MTPSESPTSEPKYQVLARVVRRDIASGALRPGDRVPSFNEMHRRYGATQNTVERVFRVLEQEGLVVRRPRSGVFVAERPTLVRTERSYVIGVSGSGFSMSEAASNAEDAEYWGRVLRGINSAAGKAGTQLMMLDHQSSNGWEKADGVVLCGWVTTEVWQRVAPHQPRVSLMRDHSGTAGVRIDDYQGGRLATEHLLSLGHRRIAYLHAYTQIRGETVVEVQRRREGYEDALRAAGITPDARWQRGLTGKYVSATQFNERAHSVMQRWLRQGWAATGCTALVAQNDLSALGAIRAMQEAGLRVPQDVSIIGFDGMNICRHVTPSLSTIEVPLEELGARSVEMLLRQIRGEAGSTEHQVLPVRLQAGKSTSRLAPSVAQVCKVQD